MDWSFRRKISEKMVLSILAQPPWALLCLSFGVLSVSRFLFSIFRSIYVLFLRPGKNLSQYGKWAVITGSTDGIGKAMAFELARRGFHLVLLGRNPEKLDQVFKEISDEVSEVEIKNVVMDFSGDLTEGIILLKDTIKDMDVGLLVNNAGVTQISPRFFDEVDLDMWENIVNVNVVAPTVITAAVLPYMLKRRRGAIVNVGSAVTHVVPSYPLYSVYAASKRYISHLTKSLHHEYKRSGIHVQSQIPCYVATKMIRGFKPSFFVATPLQYVLASLRCIGYGAEYLPYWTHMVEYYILRLSPAEFILDWIMYTAATKIRNRKRNRRNS